MIENFSVIIPNEIHQELFDHLIREDGQEDLCFATYCPSTGSKRFTGILRKIILPKDEERQIHGNVGFLPQFFERVIRMASQRKEGIVFLHSHPWPGWQGMSYDDKVAELRISPAVWATSNLPLLGLTLGTDGAWSARFWVKDSSEKRKYNCTWCETVRVIGKGLKITFNDNILKPTFDSSKQLRTISAWGEKVQKDLSRLKIGIVGLGSVGSIVAEILARTGISSFTLIDFDSVEEKNLDRLTNAFKEDIGKAKVEAISNGIRRSATSPNLNIEAVDFSICEKEGFLKALNCDLLFCCVDRPWPRQVLNYIAYSHMIPVIDGGIKVRTNNKNTKIIGSDWKVQTVGYKLPCLQCIGQYKTEDAKLEREGYLDDPSYIEGLENQNNFNAHENVFVFSSHLASMEVLQMLSMFISPSGIADLGQQTYHFTTGHLDKETKSCHQNCFFQSTIGQGDSTKIEVWADHKIAENARRERK